jgi:hypothetical protein
VPAKSRLVDPGQQFPTKLNSPLDETDVSPPVARTLLVAVGLVGPLAVLVGALVVYVVMSGPERQAMEPNKDPKTGPDSAGKSALPIERRAEERSEPGLPEEKAARKYILDHAGDPRSVEFVKWGPHNFHMAGQTNSGWEKAIRVCLRAKNDYGAMAYNNWLVMIDKDGTACTFLPNDRGDLFGK